VTSLASISGAEKLVRNPPSCGTLNQRPQGVLPRVNYPILKPRGPLVTKGKIQVYSDVSDSYVDVFVPSCPLSSY
jgi:hypothetical protein